MANIVAPSVRDLAATEYLGQVDLIAALYHRAAGLRSVLSAALAHAHDLRVENQRQAETIGRLRDELRQQRESSRPQRAA